MISGFVISDFTSHKARRPRIAPGAGGSTADGQKERPTNKGKKKKAGKKKKK